MPQTQFAESQSGVKDKTQKSRDLRGKLRNLSETIRHDGEDLADHTKNLLAERVNELNDLSKQVQRPSEQADDSEAFYVLTQRGAEMAKRVAVGKGRSANDFLRHLKAAYVAALDAQEEGAIDPSAFDWKRLGRRVSRYFRHAAGVSCMLGPMDQAPKAKRAVQRLQRKPVGEAVAVQVLQAEEAEAQEKRETERNMETMWGLLRRAPGGVGLLELTMNPASFAQFAENLFTLSFLVNQKRARIARDGESNARGLRVWPNTDKAQKEAARDGRDKAGQRMQFVLAYDMAQWREWARFVRPEDCLMPHRQEDPEAAAQAAAAEPAAAAAATAAAPDGSDGDGAGAGAAAAGPSQPRGAKARRGQGRARAGPSTRADSSSSEAEERAEEPEQERPVARKRLRRGAAQ